MMKNNTTKVLSLGVGLSVGIVLIAKVFFELSYDSFYKNIERVYNIRTWYSQNGDEKDYSQVSGGVAMGFMNEVPGVEAGTRTTFVFNKDIYLDDAGNKLSGSLVCADTCFFKVFDRPILAGNPVKALGKWGCLMVSRSFADKMLSRPGDYSSVIGKQISNESMPGLKMTVEGVFEDFPKNGTLSYDILLSMETFGKQSTDNWLGNDRYKGYVILADGVDPNGLKDAIRKMQEAHQPLEEIEAKGTSIRYFLSPFSKFHTSAPEVRTQIILLSIVAFLLILISLLNYILIVISSMVKRSKEFGVRKCYGAEAKDIYMKLSGEAFVHLAFSLILAGIIIMAGHGIIENLLGVPFRTLMVPQSIAAIVAVLLMVLIVSIVVPAELYQRIPVYAALKNYTENSRKWKLGLLGIQILINVFLVIMMLIISRQYEKVSNSDPGYDYKNLYYFDIFGSDQHYLQSRAVATLKSIPEVSGVAASNNLPYQGSSGDNIMLPEDKDRQLFNIADQYEVSEDFYNLLNIQFIQGCAPRDSSEVAVDEKFVSKMKKFTDWSDGAVGKFVLITGHDVNDVPFRISGVYKSYLIGNLKHADSRPSALFYGEIGSKSSWMPHTLFKVNPEALEKVRGALSEAMDGSEINIVSYGEAMREAYSDSKKMRNTIALGVVFSLVVALLGLIGFIKDESQRRSKEMAIRKINGATSKEILRIFALDILKLSLTASVIASIVSYSAADKWLQQFAERVALTPVYFITGSILVVLIVLIAVVLNCIKIAGANPVESLKNE